MALDFDIESLFDNGTFDPVAYQYFHQLFDRRTVLFNDGIDENIVEKVYLPLREFESDDLDKPVTLIINSMGGSVTDGFFLAHYIAHYKKQLNIIITGCAASMAAIILAGGGNNPKVKRSCFPCSYALIHDGYVAISASETKTAQDVMAFNESVDAQIRQFIIDNTKITAEQYDAHARKQWFLTAEEMKKLNLVDEILYEDDNNGN